MIVSRKLNPATKYEKEYTSIVMDCNMRDVELIVKLLSKEFDGSDEYRHIEDLLTTIRGSIKESDGIKEYTWAELHPDRV